MRPTARALVALTAVAASIATACGSDGDDDDTLSSGSATDGAAEQTVEIEMVDNAFDPTTLDVEAGETVRFVFTNTGAVDHDAFVGDAAAQAEHEEEMRAAEEEGSGGHMDMSSETTEMDMGSESTDMGDEESEMGSEDEHGITIAPGETGELTHTFTEPGTLEIGCHEPGHYEAGMKVTVTVS